MTLLLAFLLMTSDADSTQAYYAEKNVEALHVLLRDTADRETALLCRYRLYPLTEDEAYLQDLPTDLEQPTARELALLAGLWGYRVREASVLRVPRYGTRSQNLLERARALDPDDPYVLLIEGQSLLFRPRLFGGDTEAALRRFERLRAALPCPAACGITRMEADLWIWYALKKLDHEHAPDLRDALLAQNPPPLYREFLQDPP